MHHPNHPERFHALDATRAFALLLGVVFHATWFFAVEPVGTPVKDVSANHVLGWFFHASHTFRMQLFFLIAGFFARLVYHRRGLRIFAVNRFRRIAIPFLVGWLILFPSLIAVWVWGRNLSGQNGVDLPPLLVPIGVALSGAIFVPRSDGGAFGLAHLWFLYCLLWFYVLTIGGRALLVRTPLGTEAFRSRIDRLVRFLASSPWGAVVLAALMTPLVWSMRGWFGVDTPAFSLVPAPAVIGVYLGFFLLGWLVHRQAGRLGEFFRPWRLYLLLGLAGSIGLYAFFQRVGPYDAAMVPPHALTWRDVGDWDAFRASLAAGDEAPEDDLALGQLWSALAPKTRGFVEAGAGSLTFDQRYGILIAVNQILMDPQYLTPDFRPKVTLREPRAVDPTAVPEHRAALQPFLRGVAAGDYREAPWYQPTKLAYSALYCLTMAWLVYGCLGAFQALCDGFSPTWRYLADSSYWVYLVHIPLLPAFEVMMFDWEVSAWIKFPLLCLVSLAVLYGTYHYLARSTFIGRALNGRSYPFHWNPLEAIRQMPGIPSAAPLGGSPVVSEPRA